MYCLFHSLPVQACRGTTQPQANKLQQQLKSLIACVDWWKMKQLGKNQTLPTGFTDTFWQSGHIEEYYNLSFQSLAQEHWHIFSRAPPQFFLTEISNTLQLQPLPPPFFWLLNTLLILTFSFFPINCQRLPISPHSCAASSVPCSTLSRVRQAKGKKKQTSRRWVSREKLMLLPVSVSSITIGTDSENNCRESLWALQRDTLCFSAEQQHLLMCLGTCNRASYTEVQRIWRTDRWRFSNQCDSFIVLNTCLSHWKWNTHFCYKG